MAETILSDFEQACLMSFRFSFRVPSETLQLRRAYRNDRMAEFPPHAEKALVGSLSVNGTDYMAVKMY